MKAGILKTGIFFFTRAGAHAFETLQNRIVISAIVIFCSVFSFATTKSDVYSHLKTAPDATERVADLAKLMSMHLSASDVDQIKPFLTDADARVRSQAVAVLGSMKSKAVVDELLTVLSDDKDPGVRMSAAFWLGSSKSSRAISGLEEAMQKDNDANVRAQAAQALKTIGSSAAKSALRKGRTDKDKRVKKLANE